MSYERSTTEAPGNGNGQRAASSQPALTGGREVPEPAGLGNESGLARPSNWGWWRWVLGLAAALIIGLGTLVALQLLARSLAVLVLGLALAAALAPIIDWLSRRMSRLMAIVLVYVVPAVLLAGTALLVVPPLIQQGQQVGALLPKLMSQGQAWLNAHGWLTDAGLPTSLSGEANQLATHLLSLPLMVFTSVFDVVVVVFVSVYALIEAPRMQRFLLSLAPRRARPRLSRLLSDMAQAMGGYVRGSAINGIIMAVLTFVGLSIIGSPYPLVLALLAGLLELVPVIGPIVAVAIAVALNLTQSWDHALVVLVYETVIQQTESHILVPNIMRRQTNIPALLAVLALVAGGAIGGLLGALIAIPLAAAANVVVGEVIAPAVRHWSGADREGEVPGVSGTMA